MDSIAKMIAVVTLLVISGTEEAEGLKCPFQFIWENETRAGAELAKYAVNIKKDWEFTKEKTEKTKTPECSKKDKYCVTFYCIDVKNHAMWAAFICADKRENGVCKESDLRYCRGALTAQCNSCEKDNCNQNLINALNPTTTTSTTTTTKTTTQTPSVIMSTAGGEVSARLSAIPVLLLFGSMLIFHLLV
uniref:Conserved secreted protein n=1 Tax=Globodera pallida TaxID=36090 RepID=A0A183BMY5_GLOPA